MVMELWLSLMAYTIGLTLVGGLVGLILAKIIIWFMDRLAKND